MLLFCHEIVENSAQNLKCEDKGCYEVVKVFAELLEQKVSETDIVSKKQTKIKPNLTHQHISKLAFSEGGK